MGYSARDSNLLHIAAGPTSHRAHLQKKIKKNNYSLNCAFGNAYGQVMAAAAAGMAA